MIKQSKKTQIYSDGLTLEIYAQISFETVELLAQ